MPRIKYRNYRPRGDAQGIIVQANDILESYAKQGFGLTLRQLYYQFIAQDLLPEQWGWKEGTKNTEANYKKLGKIISAAREGGLIDWSHISDRGRSVSSLPHWRDAHHFLKTTIPQFHLDHWQGQKYRVEVWVEKDALSDVVEQACEPWDVPSFACKGYTSSSAMWEAAHNRMLKKYAQAEQKTIILHLGDHDPSGIDMTRDIQERLWLFSSHYEQTQRRAEIRVERIALNMDQVEQYEPPPNPAKLTDSRAEQYVADFGDLSWELDALEPAVLVELIQDHIGRYLDHDLFEERAELLAAERAKLETFLEEL